VIFNHLIRTRVSTLARFSPVTSTPNNPPVWDQQPAPVFTQGSASNYSLVDLTSDPDSDPVDVTLNAVSLPTGVTYNTTLDRLEYDGAGAVDQTTGHIATADDGTDTTDSISFPIAINAVSTAHGRPGIIIHHIGGRTESDRWRNDAMLQRLAIAHEVTFNFADVDSGHLANSVSTVKSYNQNIRVHQYRDWTAFLQGNPLDQSRQSYIEDNFITPANGGTETDGMSRTAAGAIINGWPNKNDLNPTDFPNTYLGDLPCEWTVEQVWNDFYTGAFANTFDDFYSDIWRWFGRYSDGNADWNRDGEPYDQDVSSGPGRYEDYDPTGTHNSALIRGKVAVYDRIQSLSNTARGTGIELLGNIGSWCGWWDQGEAWRDLPNMMPANQPQDMIDSTQGGMIENWGWVNGYNNDGTSRPGSFEEGYKHAQRTWDTIGASTATNTVRVWVHFHVNSSLLDLAAYLAGVAEMAGCYIFWAQGSDHKNPGELDEWFGQNLSGMTTAQKVAALGYMGLPIGDPPEYGDAFIADTNGGIIESGVYGRHYTDTGLSSGTDTAFLLVNPDDNGFQTISAPAGSWQFIDGGQRSINDGSNVVDFIDIPEGTTIILVPQ